MKALMRKSNEPYDMKLMDISEPTIPHKDWIKVRVIYAGICGSDIKMLKKDCSKPDSKLKPPVIPGHEWSGIVCETGQYVKNVKPGDRVVCHTMVDACGSCEYCLTGNWGLCHQRKGIGSTINGGFAQYLICPSKNAIKLPEQLSLKTAVLAEPLACAIRITEEIGKIKRGEKVIIFGPGTIGACCAIIAKANGAIPVVIGTKHSSHRLNNLRSLGMKCLVNDDSCMKQIETYFQGAADVAIDAVGNGTVFNQAIRLVKKMGRVIIGAVDEFHKEYSVDMVKVFSCQIQILASCSSTPYGWHKAVEMLERYEKEYGKLIGTEFPMEKWEEAFQRAEGKEDFKVVLRPGKQML